MTFVRGGNRSLKSLVRTGEGGCNQTLVEKGGEMRVVRFADTLDEGGFGRFLNGLSGEIGTKNPIVGSYNAIRGAKREGPGCGLSGFQSLRQGPGTIPQDDEGTVEGPLAIVGEGNLDGGSLKRNGTGNGSAETDGAFGSKKSGVPGAKGHGLEPGESVGGGYAEVWTFLSQHSPGALIGKEAYHSGNFIASGPGCMGGLGHGLRGGSQLSFSSLGGVLKG
jgi:hypothetical protein